MKKNMAKMTAVTMAAAMMLAACGGSTGSTTAASAESEAAGDSAADTAAAGGASGESGAAAESQAADTESGASEGAGAENTAADGNFTVGIAQFADHASLDNCREGFLEGLAEAGFEEGKNLTVEYNNANADGSTATLINQTYVGENVDLICAIATPIAQAAYAATRNTDIPVIYTAVTDPVAAELATADGKPVGNITGTSDEVPITQQLEMIHEILPEAKTLAIMYATSEASSAPTVEKYQELAGDYGLTINAVGVSTTADIPLAADSMLQNCDAVTMIMDNTVVSSLPVILSKANAKKIPVFGSEIEQVKKGCLAAVGLDYVALGKQTGEMAAKVLKGEAKASDMNYETIKGGAFYGNTKVAADLGLELPADLVSSAAEMFDTITE